MYNKYTWEGEPEGCHVRSPRPRLGDETMSLRDLMTTLMVLKQELKLK